MPRTIFRDFRGVGEKTATKLVAAYGTIENACAHVEEIKPTKAKNAFLEHYDLAVLSKKLATIDTDSPIDFVLEDARLTDLYTPEAFALFKSWSLRICWEDFSVMHRIRR